MKTIIAGSRSVTDSKWMAKAIEKSGFDITEVLCGMAAGADALGFDWAMARKIPVREFHADWDRFGRGAGVIRNTEMAQHADALIALWDGKSKGTKQMIEVATKSGLKVYVETPFDLT